MTSRPGPRPGGGAERVRPDWPGSSAGAAPGRRNRWCQAAGADHPAKYINRHFEAYIEQLKPPFFGRIIEFNESSNEMWTCPGHNGGMFYRRSPVGRVFYEYLGETVFRTDLDNSVVELGDLLVHEGPARNAEAAAAEIFGAGRTYFVLNGTSTSNKVATGALSPASTWRCSTATTTSPITTAPWYSAAASPSTCRPIVTRRA